MSYTEHSQPPQDYQAGAERGGIGRTSVPTDDQAQRRGPPPAQTRKAQLHQKLERERETIGKILAGHGTVEGLYAALYSELRKWTPDKMGKVDIDSVVDAVRRCAELRLMPGPRCTIIPRWDKDRNAFVAGVEPTYQAIADVMRAAWPEIVTIQTDTIHENDRFEFVQGSDPKLLHVPPRPGQDRGKLEGAYCCINLRDGRFQVEVIPVGELEKIRSMSKKPNGGPWRHWEREMHRKAPLKRASKYCPSTPELERLIALDNEDSDFRKLDSKSPQRVPMRSPVEEPAKEPDKGPDKEPDMGATDAQDSQYGAPASTDKFGGVF